MTYESDTQVDLELDGDTAIKIAEIVLAKVYGEKVLKQRPWKLVKEGEIFKIEGTIPGDSGRSKGGVAEIKIQARDAAVVSIIHGK